jgi:hypothetical protein
MGKQYISPDPEYRLDVHLLLRSLPEGRERHQAFLAFADLVLGRATAASDRVCGLISGGIISAGPARASEC